MKKIVVNENKMIVQLGDSDFINSNKDRDQITEIDEWDDIVDFKKTIITSSKTFCEIIHKKILEPVEVEKNMMWLPLFHYGNKCYGFTVEFKDTKGRDVKVTCYGNQTGINEKEWFDVLTPFDRDVYIAVCQLWKKQGKKNVVFIIWDELIEMLSMEKSKSSAKAKLKESINKLQKVTFRIENGFKVVTNTNEEKFIENLDNFHLLYVSAQTSELGNRGMWVEFPILVHRNLEANGYDIIDNFILRDPNLNSVAKRLYEIFEISKYNKDKRTFKYSMIASRIPLVGKNITARNKTITTAIKKLLESEYIREYEIINGTTKGDLSVKITYNNQDYLIAETKSQQKSIAEVRSEFNDVLKGEQEVVIDDYLCKRLDKNTVVITHKDSEAQNKEQTNNKNQKNTQQQASADSFKQYSSEVRLFKDELNRYLEINSIGLELVNIWLNTLGSNVITELAKKSKENAKDILGRHGYLIKSVKTYMENNQETIREQEHLQREFELKKQQEAKAEKQKTPNTTKAKQTLDANWYTNSMANPPDIMDCRKSLIQLFGEDYFYLLIEAVVKDNTLFGIDSSLQIKNDKGMAVMLTRWFIDEHMESLGKIKEYLEKISPVNNEEPKEKVDTITDIKAEVTTTSRKYAASNLDSLVSKPAVVSDVIKVEPYVKECDDIPENQKPVVKATVKADKVDASLNGELTGEMLKIAREKAGMSTRELGAVIGSDQSSIVRWEKGYRVIPKKYISILISTLQI